MIDLFPLKHEPCRPARPDVYAEGIFVESWQRFLATPTDPAFDDEPLEVVLCNLVGEIDQRSATVAASFICWLGTNIGRGFLLEAERMKAKFPDAHSHAYLAAWTFQNMRRPHVNSGWRTINAILPDWPVEAADIEVADSVAYWLGTERGQRFLREVNAEIEETCRQLRERNAMQIRARNRAVELLKEEGKTP